MTWILRFLAYFVSVIFHPLLILTYMLVILMIVNPYLFGGATIGNAGVLILTIFLFSVMIPGVSVLMMRALGMVDSIELKDRQERIGPYIVTGVLYLWIFRNFLDNPQIPDAYSIFILGATIGLFLAFFINLFSKISMHAVGMGGLLGMILITLLRYSFNNFSVNIGGQIFQMSTSSLFIAAILACGIVGSARLLLSAHHPRDIYGGFIVGLGAQFLALAILG
jgi:membrane-associated phospholipid phosphatase